MTDAELDAFLRKANEDLIASLNIDTEAALRDVLRRARPRRRTRVRLLLRAYWVDILCGVVAIGGVLWALGMAS